MRSRTSAAVGLVLLVGCGGGGGGTGSNPTGTATPTPVPTPAPTPTPVSLNVSGGWRSQARAWNFQLTQNGTSLTGVVTGFKNITYSDLNDPVLQITGTVGPGSAVAFKAPVYAIDFTGVAESSGLRMTGTLYDCANACRNYGEILDKQ
jgi:hypothetical protein